MALTRSQVISQTLKKAETYSDFRTNFSKHPITNELLIVKNEDSIKQSFKNLILTNVGERLFNPWLGSNINRTLFENFSPFLVEDVQRYIFDCAKQYEKRIVINSITIIDQSEKNGYSIDIVFSVINNPEPISLNVFIRRVR